jgi:hypothetical protein
MKRNKDDAMIIAERINQILEVLVKTLARSQEHIDSHLIENLESFTK